ncbi:MAG: PepSY-associated TM helix domain-containing protein [Vicinamibacterales bacterium]
MRRALLFVHRWLGLTAGVVFAITALTGAILVYSGDLDVLLDGAPYQTQSGPSEPDAISSAVQRSLPGSRLVRVVWPNEAGNILLVRLIDNGTHREFELDAGSGALRRPSPRHPLLRAIRRLHTSLLAGRLGSYLVWYATLASLGSLVLGVWLWWPGIRRITTGFRLRLRRNMFVVVLDAHQTLGILALPLLLTMAVTAIVFDPVALRVAERLVNGANTVDWARLRSASSAAAPDIGLAGAARAAQAASNNATLQSVTFPQNSDGIVDVRMRDAEGLASTRLALDRRTGEILARVRLRYDEDLNFRLHSGLVGGDVVRALYSAACLVGFSLLPTGVAVWWIRRRRTL